MRFLLASCSLVCAVTACLALAVCPVAAQSPATAAEQSVSAAKGHSLNLVALEEYLRYLNLWGENVRVSFGEPTPSPTLPGYLDLKVTASVPNASLDLFYFVSPDGERIVRAKTSDRLGKTVFLTSDYPFQAEQAALDLAGRPGVGPENAPVTVAVFSDFQCGFCREEAKLLRANLLSAYPDQVRLVFIDFPLVQIHDWAKPAAIAGHCVATLGDEQFWKYHDWVFDMQPQINAQNFPQQFQSWAQTAGLDSLRLQQCQQSPESEAAVMASFQKAIALGLNSTPTLFVNGRQVAGKLEWATLKQIMDAELDFQFKQASRKQAAKDACCTVTLPGLFPQ